MSSAIDSADEFDTIKTTTDENDDISLECSREGCPAPVLVKGLSAPSLRSFIVRAVTHNQQYHGASDE